MCPDSQVTRELIIVLTHLGDVHYGVYDLWHVGLHGLDRPRAL